MPDFDPADFENALIDQLRANSGEVVDGPLKGHPLMVLTSTGAKSGQPRRAILTFSRDGERLHRGRHGRRVADGPSWVPNLRAHPHVAIEAEGPDVRGRRARSSMTARSASGCGTSTSRACRGSAPYPEQTGRVIPVIRLTPATADDRLIPGAAAALA